jgi:hypothetical protein
VRGQNAPEVILLTLAQLPEMDFSSAADISMGLADIE